MFAGFDRSDYPGFPVMMWLRVNTNLRWCGFYLPSPSHRVSSWTGSRAELAAMGWGFACVYVGQQTMGPGSHNATAAQGAIDGTDCCAKMKAEDFPLGSFVYLDLENPDPVHQSVYVAAWIDAVVAGGYGPGVYTSFMDSPAIHALRPGVRIWSFKVKTVQPHRVAGSTFSTPDPADASPVASVWQFDDAAIISCTAAPGGTLLVDLNSATMADPSLP